MKALVITPKNTSEYKFITDLLSKLGVGSSDVTREELEDFGLLKLMKVVDKTKKVSRSEVLRKLTT
jgi:hypothetical protein